MKDDEKCFESKDVCSDDDHQLRNVTKAGLVKDMRALPPLRAARVPRLGMTDVGGRFKNTAGLHWWRVDRPETVYTAQAMKRSASAGTTGHSGTAFDCLKPFVNKKN